MSNLSPVLRVGTRNSKLALIQTEQVISFIGQLVPFCQFTVTELSSPGDRNQQMDLRISPPDFFTKDLDEAILNSTIDMAVHSAKDMPQQLRDGLDWCWLPVKEDPRDAVIFPAGKTTKDIPPRPRIGISSDRRESWCRKHFPDAHLLPIRGTIGSRLEQLDAGNFDIVITAAAALIRLGLRDRISEWIDSDDLQVPDGQGVLAITFRQQDPFWTELRKIFVKQVIFAGAGCGRAGTCTMETAEALRHADICIYDALLDNSVIDMLNPDALKIDAGKRLGNHTIVQEDINKLIADYARRGLQVIRLKGGDPGIFGRLAEEVTTLDNLKLPYTVYPGISSLQCATTGTGMLLTRRSLSRGFCVITPRSEGGTISCVNASMRASLPQVHFMGLSSIDEICNQLLCDGTPAETKAAVVFGAGTVSEFIIRGTIDTIPSLISDLNTNQPGIIIIGDVTDFSYQKHGALGALRVLVTCSDTLQKTAIKSINDFGGFAIPYPAIKLIPDPDGLQDLAAGIHFDWMILTSPSAVHATISALKSNNIDIRKLPPIVVSGDGTANALLTYQLKADIIPTSNFGAESLLTAVSTTFKAGQTVLRLRSDVAGSQLSDKLTSLGVVVTDRIICHNQTVHSGKVPEFDVVYFASSSAVASLLDRVDPVSIAGKTILAIGNPTVEALKKRDIKNVIMSTEALTENAIHTLAITTVRSSIKNLLNKGINTCHNFQ